MLLGLDEYPFHQITETFAGVSGSDPQWNDGHYVCLSDLAGHVSLTSTVRLYSNNDVMDGFVCLRHAGRQYNIRVSRRLRPDMEHLQIGPLRIEIVEPMQTLRLVLEDNDFGFALDVTCHSSTVPYQDPVEITRVDGRLISERTTYEITGRVEGWIDVAGSRYPLETATDSFFRNHSWGFQNGRGGPRLYAAPMVGVRRRLPGVRQWVLFNFPDHGGFFFQDPSGRKASGQGVIMLADRTVPVTSIESDLQFYEGGRRLKSGRFELTDADNVVREYGIEDLGWVYCQGGGYFGGFDDGLGQGVYRGDYHQEGEVWDVSHPTRIVDVVTGNAFEFDHAWAENFTRLTSGGQSGLAHYECVVIQEEQGWSAPVGARSVPRPDAPS